MKMSPTSAVVLGCLLVTALAFHEENLLSSGVSSAASVKAMERVFLRSEEEHMRSMTAIAARLTTTEKAMQVLRERNITTPALLQVADGDIVHHTRLRASPKGYSGIAGAKKLLNDMIYESSEKYDQEIAKCTAFYSSQCALLAEARGEISGANYMCAQCRAGILHAQAQINSCEVSIPTKELALKDHNAKCKDELKTMNDRLKIILEDIKVMTYILTLTDCSKKMLLEEEIGMMRCEDNCTGASSISFKHPGLASQMHRDNSCHHLRTQRTQ